METTQSRQSRAFASFLILLAVAFAASGIWVVWRNHSLNIAWLGLREPLGNSALLLGLFLGTVVAGLGAYLRRTLDRRVESVALFLVPILAVIQLNQVALAHYGYLAAQPDSKLGYRLRAGSTLTWWANPHKLMRINSEGMNSDEVPLEKHPGGTRVLVIGDSVTMGFELDRDETYPAMLEEIPFNRGMKDRRRFHVLNAGVMGYGSDQERMWLEEKLHLNPDIVVFQLCMNDPMDYVQKGPQIENTWHNRLGLLGFNGGFMPWLTNATGIGIHFAIRAEPMLKKERDKRWADHKYIALHDTSSPEKARNVELGWQAVEKEVLASRELSEKAGAKFLFLMVPLGDQITDLSLNASQDRMIRFSRQNKIEMVDFSAVFRKLVHRNSSDETPAQALSRYFMSDGIHFTPEGNRVVAEAIYSRISSLGWMRSSEKRVDEWSQDRVLSENKQ